MDLAPMDFSHRLLRWVDDHKKQLMLVLVLGVGFFASLAAWTAWINASEDKAQEALYSAQGKMEALERVVQDFPGSRAALFALIDIAQHHLGEKKTDLCIANYQKVYDKAGREIFFKVLALHGVAGCHKANGDFKKAAEVYERAAKEPGHLEPLVSRFEAVRALQMAGDPQTEKLYQDLLQEKNLTPRLKNQIEEQLKWLHPPKKS